MSITENAQAIAEIMNNAGFDVVPVETDISSQPAYVGEHFADYDSYLALSHFKGHAMAGFGGAIQNISIRRTGTGRLWSTVSSPGTACIRWHMRRRLDWAAETTHWSRLRDKKADAKYTHRIRMCSFFEHL